MVVEEVVGCTDEQLSLECSSAPQILVEFTCAHSVLVVLVVVLVQVKKPQFLSVARPQHANSSPLCTLQGSAVGFGVAGMIGALHTGVAVSSVGHRSGLVALATSTHTPGDVLQLKKAHDLFPASQQPVESLRVEHAVWPVENENQTTCRNAQSRIDVKTVFIVTEATNQFI